MIADSKSKPAVGSVAAFTSLALWAPQETPVAVDVSAKASASPSAVRSITLPDTTQKALSPPKHVLVSEKLAPPRSSFYVELDDNAPSLQSDNTLDEATAAEWVDAHKGPCKHVAEALVRNIQHVDLETFIDGLHESVSAFEANLPHGETYLALVEPRRGSGWVYQHALPMLSKLPQDVGNVDLMYKFVKELSLANPAPRHVVYFDDASYSGEQLYERLALDIISRLENHIDGHLTMHVVVPFMTSVALKKLQNMELPENVTLRIAGEPQRLHAIADLARDGKLTEEQVRLIRTMYPEAGPPAANRSDGDPLESVTLAYMAHKVPDGWSCLSSVLREGEVRGEDGAKTSEEEYHFVPRTIPPYRKTGNW